MSKIIDYYFFMISPFAYLGSRELERIAHEQGATVNVKPIAVKTTFSETGGVPPAQRPKPRQDYRFVELERWSRVRNLPLHKQPAHFPVPDELAACIVLAVKESGGNPLKLAHALLTACWSEERDISDVDTVRQVVAETGHDAGAIMSKAQTDEMRGKFVATTREALDSGVFGSPWYVVDGEPFWGQDRLDLVERKLANG